MKKKFKLCFSPSVMATVVMLTGCGNKAENEYDASQYYVVFVDGEPHLTTRGHL